MYLSISSFNRFLLIIFLFIALVAIPAQQAKAGLWDDISKVFSGGSGDSDSKSAPKSNKVMHVTAKALNVRDQPNAQSKIVGRFTQHQDIYKIKNAEPGWAYVRGKSSGVKGYVSTKYIKNGDGWTAWLNTCRANGISRPQNSAILSRSGSGKHSLVVKNAPGSDALVKLKNMSGGAVLTMYVRSGQTAKANVPEGRYQFQYASGKDFSRSCNRFLVDMVASKDPNYIDFVAERRYSSTTYMEQTYTLQRVVNGNFSPRSMSANDF
jgi:hypothetical protein